MNLTAVFFFETGAMSVPTKSNHLWLRGSVSIILNPFLRVLSISGLLKVIHTPKISPDCKDIKNAMEEVKFSGT